MSGQDNPDVEAEKNKVPLDKREKQAVEERRSIPAHVVHEVVRRQGIEELERPVVSLIWSGIAGGVCIGMSVLGVAIVHVALPPSPARDAIAAFGYSLGFIIVILGRLQLFTESTVTAIIPLATHPTAYSLARTARLWSIVLLANFVGTFAFSLYVWAGGLGLGDLTVAALDVSRITLNRVPLDILLSGIPAGFMMAALVWSMPSAPGQTLLLIVLFTGLIDLGHFSHVIAGSAEAWLTVLAGKQSLGSAVGTYLLPALIGNIVGGSVLFAVIAHAQVRQEITS